MGCGEIMCRDIIKGHFHVKRPGVCEQTAKDLS
jgi:hypothetical protein